MSGSCGGSDCVGGDLLQEIFQRLNLHWKGASSLSCKGLRCALDDAHLFALHGYGMHE